VLNVHLVVDASRSMDWGEPNKLDYTRSVLAAMGYLALSSACRVYGWPLTSSVAGFGPAWGRGRAGALMSFLGSVEPGQKTTPVSVPSVTPAAPDLDRAVSGLSTRTPGLTIFASDLLSPTWQTALTRLAARAGDTVVLHVLSPRELRPELGGDVRLIDQETGGTVAVTLNNDALRMYGERLGAWRGEVESFCTRHGMTYVLVDTSVPMETLVFETLRRRGVVR